MASCLIVCHGYLGDHLFALSIAKKLVEEGQFFDVDYLVGFPQVIPLFQRNKFVRNVISTAHPTATPQETPKLASHYDKVFRLPPISRKSPPAEELQLVCGVRTPDPSFSAETDPEIDAFVSTTYDGADRPFLAIMNGWEEKTFRFTPEQYKAGIDVPYLGYGGAHRNTSFIIDELSRLYSVVMVGGMPGQSQFQLAASRGEFDSTASILKYADFFIGAEGGLANLAYAVGTKTILTSDFVHQLYGPNGVMEKNEEPKLGPVYYGGDVPHTNLDPYLTDEEVLSNIITHIESYREK